MDSRIKDADDTEELLKITEEHLLEALRVIWIPDHSKSTLREILQKAYSLGYDEAQADAGRGMFG